MRVARWYIGDVAKRRLERRDGALQTRYDGVAVTGRNGTCSASERSARRNETISWTRVPIHGRRRPWCRLGRPLGIARCGRGGRRAASLHSSFVGQLSGACRLPGGSIGSLRRRGHGVVHRFHGARRVQACRAPSGVTQTRLRVWRTSPDSSAPRPTLQGTVQASVWPVARLRFLLRRTCGGRNADDVIAKFWRENRFFHVFGAKLFVGRRRRRGDSHSGGRARPRQRLCDPPASVHG